MGASAATQDVATIVKNVKPKLLIDGKFVDAVSGKTFKTVNPHDETVIMEVAEGDAADVDIAVKAARKAFDEGPWPKMPGTERGRIINKFADLLEEHTDELAALDSLDNGKPFFWAKAADLSHVVAFFRYYAGWADKLTGLTIPTNGPYFGYTLHEPLGVIGAIVPWNFPLLMWTWKVAPALACGNTIVIKTAEQTPLSALRAGELALQAGLPAGVLNIIPGYGPTAGARLSAHPDVDKVSFTGSTEVGALVGAAAAKNIKPCTLELGGKSAAIVWKDVDIDQVVQEAHNALFFNHGQCCAAGSRTFVHEDIYDEFVEKATKLAANKKLGNPLQEGCEQGPQARRAADRSARNVLVVADGDLNLVDEEQFKKIMNYIDQGKAEGAKLNCGGKRKGDKGFYVEPTVFSEVEDHMTIATDEIFGPVQSILKYKTIDEVLRRANQSQFGLASGLWAKDIDVVNTISRGLRAGTVWVNCYNVYDAAMPFGGYKMSGVGRDKGEYALHHYTQIKAVYQQLKDSAWL